MRITSQHAQAFGDYQLHASFEEVYDEGNTRENAVEVALPSDTDANLGYHEDVDYFKVTVTAAGSLRVLAAPTIAPNTYGYLEDSDGTVLAENDDGQTWYDLRNFRIEMDVEPGTYYVKVRGYNSGVLGDYELRTRFTPDEPVPEPVDDHGDTRAEATAVALPSDTDGVLTAGDVDYFAVTVTAAGDLVVSSSGSTDTAGQLEDSAGSVLATDADSGAGSNFSMTHTVSAGTYYVKVSGAGSSTAGDYTLHALLEFAVDMDATLRAEVNAELGRESTATLTNVDLAGLTQLIANHNDALSSLSGLEYAVNLTRLEPSKTNVSDLNPLQDLSALEVLYLNNTAVTDLSALEVLSSLEVLWFNNTAVSDLSVLAKLASLRRR